MRPIDLAVKLNASFIGTTCHFLEEEVDSGKIITQGIIWLKITKDIYKKAFECGAITLLSCILKLSYYEMENKFEYDDILLSLFPKNINFKDLSNIFLKFYQQK